jgi:hypothetical protein
MEKDMRYEEYQQVNGATVNAMQDKIDALENALTDMLAGWKYIRQTHGDLYGVGWDRAQKKAEDALDA